MKYLLYFISILLVFSITSCKEKKAESRILFLHHSTGGRIWKGDVSTSKLRRFIARYNENFQKNQVPLLVKKYNKENDKNYIIEDLIFPKAEPYGWKNYPFDYYNIWVENSGEDLFMEEPTLEILTDKNDVIIFKHCFPVSNIQPDDQTPDINSEWPTLANYKLQYNAIREKLHEFPNTKFIVFTGAVQVEYHLKEEEARRAKDFFNWVKAEWDQPGDNIFIWDFYDLQTEGGLYFNNNYAASHEDSHPNPEFAGRVAELFVQRMIDIIENNGEKTTLTGTKK